MNRRTFLLGTSSLAAGGSTLLGTGAFSRVQSQRGMTVRVAEDTDAYLGLKPIDTPNSNNFVELDDHGHLKIDIGDYNEDGSYDRPTGVGINSDSNTWFEGMFDICNQGKATAEVCIAYNGNDIIDYGNITFFGYSETLGLKSIDCPRVGIRGITIGVGECVRVAIDLESKGVDATSGEPFFDGDVVVHAVAEGAGDTGD